jgi:hypothetical protein
MFLRASAFNQPIGGSDGWDVSSGTNFVSNDQRVGLKRLLKRSVVWLCFQLGCRVSIDHSCVALEGTSALIRTFFSFSSVLCLKRPQPLIKTLVPGSSPVVPTL